MLLALLKYKTHGAQQSIAKTLMAGTLPTIADWLFGPLMLQRMYGQMK